MVILAAGCGDREADAGSELAAEEVERGGTLVIAETADANFPVAILATSGLEGNLASDVLNSSLLRSDWQDGQLVYLTAEEHPAALARRYEYLGPDSAALRFHMRSDAKWSDGEPVTSEDVVFSYRFLKEHHPEIGSPLGSYVEKLDSVTAQNDSTVTFYFDRRYPEMLNHASIPPLPEHVFRGVDAAEIRNHPAIQDPGNGRLVTSGPFMIGERVKGQQITLVPNPHFQPQPNLDRIVFRVIPDPTTRQVELQTGNVDVATALTYDQIPAVRAQAPEVQMKTQDKRFYDYVAYNPEGFEAFADPEIRRALGLAIDVPTMLKALQADQYAVPAGGPYSPIFKDLYDPKTAAPLGYDPERARQILESKGWRDTDGDGIREKNGTPFRFTLTTNSGNQRRADAMQIIQQQWKNIGVDAQLRQLELATFMGNAVEGKFQAMLGGWQAGLFPDLSQLWSPESPYNFTGYDNPELARLMEQAKAQPTREAAAPYWRQVAALIARDQPYTFLYYNDMVHGVSPRVRNMEVDANSYLQNTWEWWIPRAQQRGVSQAAAPAQPS